MPSCSTTGRHFTEAAREAAARARQRKREHREQFPDDHEFALTVVRAAGAPTGFGWQIRRFGHMSPVAQSRDIYRSLTDAECSGRTALDRLKGSSPGRSEPSAAQG